LSFLWIGLAITLVVEVPIVAAFYRGQRVRMAIACAIATSATNLALNFLLARRTFTFDRTLLVGEAAALIAEGTVYFFVATDRDWRRALTASAAANLASFGVGLLLF
jgi:hypothetical protein